MLFLALVAVAAVLSSTPAFANKSPIEYPFAWQTVEPGWGYIKTYSGVPTEFATTSFWVPLGSFGRFGVIPVEYRENGDSVTCTPRAEGMTDMKYDITIYNAIEPRCVLNVTNTFGYDYDTRLVKEPACPFLANYTPSFKVNALLDSPIIIQDHLQQKLQDLNNGIHPGCINITRVLIRHVQIPQEISNQNTALAATQSATRVAEAKRELVYKEGDVLAASTRNRINAAREESTAKDQMDVASARAKYEAAQYERKSDDEILGPDATPEQRLQYRIMRDFAKNNNTQLYLSGGGSSSLPQLVRSV